MFKKKNIYIGKSFGVLGGGVGGGGSWRGGGVTYLSFFLLAPMTDLVPLGQISSILSFPPHGVG